MDQGFAFMLGSGRCGSTILTQLLAMHPDVGFISNVDDRLGGSARTSRFNSHVYRALPRHLQKRGGRRGGAVGRAASFAGQFGMTPSEGYRALDRRVSPMLSAPNRDLVAADASPWLSSRLRLFLVDRHNRGDLNLAKLGIIAMGDGGEPRRRLGLDARRRGLQRGPRERPLRPRVDLPHGRRDGPAPPNVLPPLAPRVPIYLICGDSDAASINVVKGAQPIVERHQRSKVTYFDTGLHGYRLLHFFPKVPAAVSKFLDDPVKARVIEWEPRFLLTPVEYQNEGTVEVVPSKRAEEAKKKAEATKKAEEAKKAGN